MPRAPRSLLKIYTYFHVCARGNGGQNIFCDEKDRIRYLFLVEKYRLRFLLGRFAYCLMDNHCHLLLLAPSIQKLSKAIHSLHVAYVMYFNRRHNRKGHLFQDRFSSWVIKDENHFFETKNYIENNPVKAGLAIRPDDYLWTHLARDGSLVTIGKYKSY